MGENVSLHMERAGSALADGEILLSNSGSYQGAIGRAAVAMIHAGWPMLLSVGGRVNSQEDVIPALKVHFGDNSPFYGYITGANGVYLIVEFGSPVNARSLKANATNAVSNADKFTTMARVFIEAGDKRVWSAA
jgi:uncharacterized protein (UPF0332 family)